MAKFSELVTKQVAEKFLNMTPIKTYTVAELVELAKKGSGSSDAYEADTKVEISAGSNSYGESKTMPGLETKEEAKTLEVPKIEWDKKMAVIKPRIRWLSGNGFRIQYLNNGDTVERDITLPNNAFCAEIEYAHQIKGNDPLIRSLASSRAVYCKMVVHWTQVAHKRFYVMSLLYPTAKGRKILYDFDEYELFPLDMIEQADFGIKPEQLGLKSEKKEEDKPKKKTCADAWSRFNDNEVEEVGDDDDNAPTYAGDDE